MFVDFGMARQYGGHCYLRYDDTNPEAEKQEYIDHIEEIVAWMGWAPWKITYASDYFDKLHAYAVDLIKKGFAYVDHQVGFRGERGGVDVTAGLSHLICVLCFSCRARRRLRSTVRSPPPPASPHPWYGKCEMPFQKYLHLDLLRPPDHCCYVTKALNIVVVLKLFVLSLQTAL